MQRAAIQRPFFVSRNGAAASIQSPELHSPKSRHLSWNNSRETTDGYRFRERVSITQGDVSGCILTLAPGRGLQAALMPEWIVVSDLTCGLEKGEAA